MAFNNYLNYYWNWKLNTGNVSGPKNYSVDNGYLWCVSYNSRMKINYNWINKWNLEAKCGLTNVTK